jgi:hypothetical protein
MSEPPKKKRPKVIRVIIFWLAIIILCLDISLAYIWYRAYHPSSAAINSYMKTANRCESGFSGVNDFSGLTFKEARNDLINGVAIAC